MTEGGANARLHIEFSALASGVRAVGGIWAAQIGFHLDNGNSRYENPASVREVSQSTKVKPFTAESLMHMD